MPDWMIAGCPILDHEEDFDEDAPYAEDDEELVGDDAPDFDDEPDDDLDDDLEDDMDDDD